MLEELQRGNYSENATRYYIRTVEDCTSASQRARKTISLLYPSLHVWNAVETCRLCVLRALYADFPLRATGSLLALIDFTRSADDAPSSDNP